MTRSVTRGFVFLLLLLPALAPAQTNDEAIPSGQAVSPSALPSFGAHAVPGESVVALADFFAGYLADAGDLPDFAQVGTADGQLRSISTAEAFALLARTAYLWELTGQLPSSVPIAPDRLSPPLLDAEDPTAGEFDPESGLDVSTQHFLAVCGDTVRWIDRLGAIPTAVWVDGVRLSAAQYLAGLAICIQYAYWEGELYDSLFLPHYSAPRSWPRLSQAYEPAPSPPLPYAEGWPSETVWPMESEAAPGVDPWEEPTWEQEALQYEPLVPLSDLAAVEQEPPSRPEFALYPEPGSTLSGVVDLVVSYSGPTERFVIFEIDGRSRIIRNFPPYGYRWDTSGLKPGTHTVRVQILGEDGALLIDQVSAFTIVPPGGGPPDAEPLDDL
jgi:hypothetical protein